MATESSLGSPLENSQRDSDHAEETEVKICNVEIYNGEDGGAAADKHTGVRPGYEVRTRRSRSRKPQDSTNITTATTVIGVCTFDGCGFQRQTIQTETKSNGGRFSFPFIIIATSSCSVKYCNYYCTTGSTTPVVHYRVIEMGEHKKISGEPHPASESYLSKFPWPKELRKIIEQEVQKNTNIRPSVLLQLLQKRNAQWKVITKEQVRKTHYHQTHPHSPASTLKKCNERNENGGLRTSDNEVGRQASEHNYYVTYFTGESANSVLCIQDENAKAPRG